MRARSIVLPVFAMLWLVGGSAYAAFTERVSVGLGGVEGNRASRLVDVSADGTTVVFTSDATNLALGSPYGTFVRARATGTSTRIAPYEGQAVTPDLATVAFTAYAGTLVSGDTNGASDVFVYDTTTQTVERVSVGSGDTQGNADSNDPQISSDGRLVAFLSFASNLVPGDGNYDSDVFIHDRQTHLTERVSVASNGAEGTPGGRMLAPVMTPNGQFVAFLSRAGNLAPGGVANKWNVYVRDRNAPATELVSILPDGTSPGIDTCCNGGLSITPDGRFVAFVADVGPNHLYETFVRDRTAGTTVLASVAMGGGPASGYTAFPSLSADGRFVAFLSNAPDIVPGDSNGQPGYGTDLFVRDLLLSTSVRANVATDGTQAAPGTNSYGRLSADGSAVAMVSNSPNLVSGDTNEEYDVFVRDFDCGDGVMQSPEACDDGNNTDGDGCDSDCTVTLCGNGQVTAGEACDDGADNGSDGCCSATCTLVDADGDGVCDAADACIAPRLVAAKIAASGFITFDTDRLAFKGRVVLPPPVTPPLAPSLNGIRIVIVDALARTVYDAFITGGAGWTLNGSGTVSKYADAERTLQLKIQDRTAASGVARFGLKAKGSSLLGQGIPPFAGRIFLRPPDGSQGQCGEARLSCTVGAGGDRVKCR